MLYNKVIYFFLNLHGSIKENVLWVIHKFRKTNFVIIESQIIESLQCVYIHLKVKNKY